MVKRFSISHIASRFRDAGHVHSLGKCVIISTIVYAMEAEKSPHLPETRKPMRFNRSLLVLFALFRVMPLAVSAEKSETFSREWTAAELFKVGITKGLILSPDKSSLEIPKGTVIEDDGPAAGYSYQPNVETLKGDKLLRKTLVVDRLPAYGATLLVARGGELEFQLNGQPLKVTGPKQLGPYWQAYAFDPVLLKKGKNELVITGTGSLWIAREEDFAKGSLTRKHHPNRSAKSTDGGKTWNSDQLGNKNDVDGEYSVRLALDQTQSQGTLTTPVIDLGNLDGKPIGRSLHSPGRVQVRLDGDFEDSNNYRLEVRSSGGAVPDSEWSNWSPVDGSKNHAAHLTDLNGRYVQLRCTLVSRNPLNSPRLQGLKIQCTPKFGDYWTDRLKVLKVDNPAIVRSGFKFQHENSDHPKLLKLRRDYRLDEVVKGASSEFEIITRLARWSSGLWSKMHLRDNYPPWDALEILKTHSDGTPVGGFCHQYNLVFLQACQSLGIPGRAVSIGPHIHTDRIRSGHEVVEVWSNDYQKWVYVDGNAAWYFIDPETKTPLSLWEMRQAQLDAFEQKKSATPPHVVTLAETRFEWKGMEGFPAFLELRLVPRSNFLSQLAPLPLNQGMRGWFWTGYRVWTDDRLPARAIYPHKIAKRKNFDWPINCLHFTLEPLDKPGVMRVHIDAEMPNLKSVTAKIDDQPARSIKSPFDWQLHPGRNHLELAPVNKSDRSGRRNRIEIEYNENLRIHEIRERRESP